MSLHLDVVKKGQEPSIALGDDEITTKGAKSCQINQSAISKWGGWSGKALILLLKSTKNAYTH
jgi:hypothetical protein